MSVKVIIMFTYTYMDRCKEIVYVHVFMDCHLLFLLVLQTSMAQHMLQN